MTQDGGSGAPATLEEAQALIARQAREIEHLRRRVEDDRLVEDLRDAIRLSVAAAEISAPVTQGRLLEMIVATAADIIGANAASLFLIDREKEELVFEVALGDKAEEVKKFRVPLGHGVAGLVALTGQPMAVSDTSTDDRDAADIAEAVGYVPKNILCVPLFYGDQVTGVLELLDKAGAATFSPEDMEALGLFANQAAVAIEQSQSHGRLESLVSGFIRSLDGIPEYQRETLADRAASFASTISNDPLYQRSLSMARLVQEIVAQGERESEACTSILESFATFLRSRPAALGESGMPAW